jgi:hypothetical protein
MVSMARPAPGNYWVTDMIFGLRVKIIVHAVIWQVLTTHLDRYLMGILLLTT